MYLTFGSFIVAVGIALAAMYLADASVAETIIIFAIYYFGIYFMWEEK